MELITKDIYKVVRKEEHERVDKETGEMKKTRIAYLTNQTNEIQEQIFINNEELYSKLKDKSLIKLVYKKGYKGIYLQDIIAEKL